MRDGQLRYGGNEKHKKVCKKNLNFTKSGEKFGKVGRKEKCREIGRHVLKQRK